jgi:hypothetical protein
MDPVMCALLKPTAPFVGINNPGNFPVYANFATEAAIKMTDKQFECDKNYYLSFVNINWACFCMLDSTIADQFKVSNTPNMTGWNSPMSVCSIIEQLETSYGKPDTMSLFHNYVLFRSPFLGTEAPEMLFYRIEQCQEIQTTCTPNQIIGNAVRLLMQSGIFHLKEFDRWEAAAVKTYPILKMFINEAYSRRLTAMQLRNTAGQQGNVNQNIYNILDIDGKEDTNNNTTVTVPTVAAAMVTAGVTGGSTFAATTASTIAAEVAAAINQLSANQMAIMQHIAAMNISPPQTIAAPASNIPPIHSVPIPTQNGYAGGSINQGRSNAQNGQLWGGGHGGCGGCGGRGQNPFAMHMANLGGGMAQHLPPLGGFHGAAVPNTGFPGATIPPPIQPPQQQRNANYSNIYKRYNNWNVCFSCGFDIKDGHTSQTCPFQKPNHQTGYTRENPQQYIAVGYDPSTKGMRKSVLPTARYNLQCEAEVLAVAHKCKSLVSATPSSLDPTPPTKATCVENDAATVIISNCSSTKLTQKLIAPSLAATARAMFGNPMPQYLTALMIAANQAIADTGATSIFIMEGTDMANKCIATSMPHNQFARWQKDPIHTCV